MTERQNPILVVSAEALAEATRPALPKRKTRSHKPRPVALAYDRFIQTLRISEVRHGAFQTTIPLSAPAIWSKEIIVDGVLLARTVATFQPDVMVTLAYDDAFLIVRSGAACVQLNRFADG